MRRFVTAALIAGLVPATALAQQQPSSSSTPAPAAAPAPRPTPWAASQLSITTTANGSFFDRNYTLSGDAASTADLNVSLRPRYRLSRTFQLRARWDFNYEFTNSDTTSTLNEPRFGDPTLDLWYTGLPALGPVRLAIAGGLAFPVSVESRANTMILTPRVIGQVAWAPDAFGGEFALIGQAFYSHAFTQYTTAGVRGERPYHFSCVGSTIDCSDQLRGSTNVHDQFSWNIIAAQTWGNWSPGLLFGMVHQWAYDVTNPATANAANVGATDSHVRQSTLFYGWLDYNPNPWLTIEAGYYLYRNILDGDGTYGNPIYAPYQDWRVYLNANIVLDKLFEVISGSGAAGGGVIRTQNTPRRGPIVRF